MMRMGLFNDIIQQSSNNSKMHETVAEDSQDLVESAYMNTHLVNHPKIGRF